MLIPFLDEAEDEAPASSEFLLDALAQPLSPGQDIVMVAVPAPVDALEKFLRLVPREGGFLFHSPGGVQMAGGGCTAIVSAEGEGRFRALREGAEALWGRIAMRQDEGMRHTPLLVGAASFLAEAPITAPWTSFESNSFTLARWSYVREGRTARLVCAINASELARPGASGRIAKEASAIAAQLDSDSPTSLIQRGEILGDAMHDLSLEEWTRYIDEIQSAITAGDFGKVVAARRCIVDMPRNADDTAVMARLFAGYPGCTHFAVRRKDATFFGATPETLFKKVGRALHTEALAGTIRVSDDAWTDSTDQADKLRASPKDRAEQAFVVRSICDELAPLAANIEHPDLPEPRRVRHLIHLRTPITGEVRDGVTVFDLISALHPTPAVGGFPTKGASKWIGEHEAMERGLYSGTVGWFDAKGDAEFAVSIRCGVLTPRRAYLYAGAGIVKDSNAESEYNETAAKMVPLLRALGASY